MQPLFDASAPRKPANLTVNADLLARARALKINLSATLEKALVEEMRKLRNARWLKENKPAIDAYNEDVQRTGVFSEGVRTF
jgi:antitoxin CcdA